MGRGIDEQTIGASTPESASRRLDDLAALDWSSAGLAPFRDWDPALVGAARIVAHAPGLMALMVGVRGILLASEAARRLLAEKAGGAIDGASILDVLPDSAAFYREVLAGALSGRGLSIRDQPIRLAGKGRGELRWFNLDFVPNPGGVGSLRGRAR